MLIDSLNKLFFFHQHQVTIVFNEENFLVIVLLSAYIVAPLRKRNGQKVAVGNLLAAEYATLHNDGRSMPSRFNIEDFNLLEGSTPFVLYSTGCRCVVFFLL